MISKLPDISNERKEVQEFLTSSVPSDELCKKYGISKKLYNERIKNWRSQNTKLKVESKEDVDRLIELTSGDKLMMSRWLNTRESMVIYYYMIYVVTDERLYDMFVNNGMSYKEITDEINSPLIEQITVQGRIKRLHFHHKPGDRAKNAAKGIKAAMSDEDKRAEMDFNRKKTLINKYGVDIPQGSVKVRAKHVDWHETKYVHSAEQALTLIEPNEGGYMPQLLDFLSKIIAMGDYEYFTKTQITTEVLGLRQGMLNNGGRKIADTPIIKIDYRVSQGNVVKFIKTLGINESDIMFDAYIPSMNKKQLDIYIPKYNFAIEFNGSFWHANKGKNLREPKPVNYHLNKTNLARKAGINLMHVWEYDWNDEIKQEIVKSQIKYHLNLIDNNSRYYARKLEVKEVNYKDKKEFLNINHIQGDVVSSENYGLYNGDELLALMTFGKRRFDDKDGWELLRFATKLNTSVAGGASKLLKVFANKHKGDTLISYANNDFSYSGSKSLYSNLGFTYVRTTVPGYKWAGITGHSDPLVVPRYSVQPFKLKAFTAGTGRATFKGEVPDYQEDDTENSYMVRHSFYKVYDAGNDLYEKIL